ncbi:hypothetical protein QUB31_10655 [Microcoleus sp. B13-B4]
MSIRIIRGRTPWDNYAYIADSGRRSIKALDVNPDIATAPSAAKRPAQQITRIYESQ